MQKPQKIQKIVLTDALVEQISFDRRPVGQNPDGTMLTVPRPEGMTDFFVRDSKLQGFSLRVTAGKKTFYAERKLGGRPCRKDCGTYPEIKLAQAKKLAQSALATMTLGTDPKLEKKKAIAEDVERRSKEKFTFGYLLVRDAQTRLAIDKDSTARDRRDIQKWTKSLPIWNVSVHELIHRGKDGRGHEQNHLATMMTQLVEERGSASANKVWRYASAAWNRMLDNELPERNPFKEYLKRHKLPKVGKRATFLPTDQVAGREWLKGIADLRKTCTGYHPFTKRVMSDYIILTLCWGARRSESAKLQWGDIDFTQKSIVFRGTKNSSDHVFPMTPGVEQILRERKADNEKPRGRNIRKAEKGEPYIASDWVFPSEKEGKHLVDPRTAMGIGEERSGLRIMLHDLRRTFAGDLAVDAVGDGSSKSRGDFGLVKLAMNHSDMKADITQSYIMLRPKLNMLRPLYAAHEVRVLTACGILTPIPTRNDVDSLLEALRANANDPVVVAAMEAALSARNSL